MSGIGAVNAYSSMGLGEVRQSGMLKTLGTLTANGGNSAAAGAPTDAQLAKLNPKARETARQFESYYIQQFVSLMSPSSANERLNESGFGGGFGEEMFRQQLNEKMADGISKQGGFGLANAILKQLVMRQEAQEALQAEAAGVTPLASPAATARAYRTN